MFVLIFIFIFFYEEIHKKFVSRTWKLYGSGFGITRQIFNHSGGLPYLPFTQSQRGALLHLFEFPDRKRED